MAGMKRFVTYIYSYEDKKKGSNVGFAKIEIRGEECRIEIHLRGIYIGRTVCKIFLIKEDAGDMAGVSIGEMGIMNGNGDFGTSIKSRQIGNTPFDIYEMEGIFLLAADERLFMSRWKEGAAWEVSRERFRVWEPKADVASEWKPEVQNIPVVQEEKPVDSAKSAQSTQTVQSTRPAQSEKPAQIAGSAQKPDSAHAACPDSGINVRAAADPAWENSEHEQLGRQKQPGSLAATEIPMRNIFPKYSWSQIWRSLQSNHPVFSPFEKKELVCVRIELKDLRELPKRYWYLGNNSFLLHGFFNYQYLAIGKLEEERWFIGIPGIYQHQERVMAAIFGFPEFAPTAVEGEKYIDGQEPLNRYGYWYRFIEE